MAIPGSWWLNPETPKEGFTRFAEVHLSAPVVMHDDSIQERVFIQRQQLLSALQALRKNKKTVGICHANVVSN